MQFTQINTVRAFGEFRHGASVHQLSLEKAGVRAGPGWFRHRTGHVLINLGQTIAHGGNGVANVARTERGTD